MVLLSAMATSWSACSSSKQSAQKIEKKSASDFCTCVQQFVPVLEKIKNTPPDKAATITAEVNAMGVGMRKCVDQNDHLKTLSATTENMKPHEQQAQMASFYEAMRKECPETYTALTGKPAK